MYWIARPWIWLSRLHRCRGFGIQSPTDYWLVRNVINEHWPYYQYATLARSDHGLRRKLGRLYFRLANWLQPSAIESDDYREYLQAGCRRATFCPSTELIRLRLGADSRERLRAIYNKVGPRSVLIVEGIRREKPLWQEIIGSEQTGVTFDLYYCGLVMFDRQRYKQHYIINF